MPQSAFFSAGALVRPVAGHAHDMAAHKEEGTVTSPFDMTVRNDLDRFHLVMDVIDRVPQTGEKGIYLKQELMDKLIEHKQNIAKHGQDLPADSQLELGAEGLSKT